MLVAPFLMDRAVAGNILAQQTFVVQEDSRVSSRTKIAANVSG